MLRVFARQKYRFAFLLSKNIASRFFHSMKKISTLESNMLKFFTLSKRIPSIRNADLKFLDSKISHIWGINSIMEYSFRLAHSIPPSKILSKIQFACKPESSRNRLETSSRMFNLETKLFLMQKLILIGKSLHWDSSFRQARFRLAAWKQSSP